MVIVVGATAIFGFSAYLRRKTKALESKKQKQLIDDAPPYRSLFAPSDEELRAAEKAEATQQRAKVEEENRLSAEKKFQAARDFQTIWTNEPNRKNTVELFRLGARSENAQVFSEAANAVLEFWRENKIADLTARDLADLLDSHLATLPQQERTSGALFWLRQEIMSLRGGSEEKI